MNKNLKQQLSIDNNIEALTLCVCSCRTSSTALLRVFSNTGSLSIFQPIKNIIRWNMFDIEYPFNIPSTYLNKNYKNIFIKETLGPYSEKEIKYQPENIILNCLNNENKFRLIVLFRDPFETWGSWKTKLEGKTNIDLFLSSYKQAYTTYINNKNLNTFPVIPFSYNLLENYSPKLLMGKLIDSANLYQPIQKADYSTFDNENNNLLWPDEPLLFKAEELHKSVLASSNYRYLKSTVELPENEKNIIRSEGLYEMFNHIEMETLNYFGL